jgi:molybdopterin-guanine dinucleotide biosynthesis protein A
MGTGDFDAIVLAGGSASRMGGADKPMLDIAGTPMLGLVVDAVLSARVRVVVGPERDITGVTWCRESPPGGGPVAAIAAALPRLGADVVVVLAADLPWIEPAIELLRTALRRSGADVAMLSTDGQLNHLAAVWRRSALVDAVRGLDDTAIDAEPRRRRPDRRGARRGALGRGLRHLDRSGACSCTPRRREPPVTLDEWVHDLSDALGVDAAGTDVPLLLDVARDAAHGIARPAAPLTTFLVGLAAGQRGGGADAVASAAAVAQRLVRAQSASDSDPA